MSPDVTLASAAAAFALLTGLQYTIAFVSARVPEFQKVVKARPTLLVRDGALREDVMERHRVTRSEVLQVLRQHGCGSLDQAAAVVLETDGTFSVVRHLPEAGGRSTLADVAGWT